MKATCQQDPTHQEFYTTAHVAQDWRVTADGTFIENMGDLETTHGPDPRNIWICAVCGAEVKVEG